jgi:hypothetical protein
LKGQGLMVDEPTIINIVEVPNGLAITQPKKKKKANGKLVEFITSIGLQDFHGYNLFMQKMGK